MSQPINIQRISLGKLDNVYDVNQLIQHLKNLYNSSIPVVTGNGAPTVAPTKISGQYIDLTNKQVYVAVGNSKTTDWVKVS